MVGKEKEEGKKQKAKSSLAGCSQDRIRELPTSYENLQFSNLLSAPMTTWPLVVVSPLLELLGWEFLADPHI